METIKREGFMAFFLITEPADYKFFYFGIIYRSAFLFLTCKGSLFASDAQGGPSGWLAKIILTSLRYFFAKPCTIRAKDKCLTCKR